MNQQDYQRGYDDGYAAAMYKVDTDRVLSIESMEISGKAPGIMFREKDGKFISAYCIKCNHENNKLKDKPKKIEKLDTIGVRSVEVHGTHHWFVTEIGGKELMNKVNELVDRLNQE